MKKLHRSLGSFELLTLPDGVIKRHGHTWTTGTISQSPYFPWNFSYQRCSDFPWNNMTPSIEPAAVSIFFALLCIRFNRMKKEKKNEKRTRWNKNKFDCLVNMNQKHMRMSKKKRDEKFHPNPTRDSLAYKFPRAMRASRLMGCLASFPIIRLWEFS